MKIKNISKLLVLSTLFSSCNISSLAGTFSEDERYETFKGSNIVIDNVMEEDNIDINIEGNTLVNLVSLPSKRTELVSVTESKATILSNFTNKNIIKPNTTYTYIVDVEVSNASSNLETYVNLDYINSNDESVYHSQRDGMISGIGKSRFLKTFTTSDNVKQFNNLFVCARSTDGNTATGTQTINATMLLEGDYSDTYIPYFEGLKSVGEKSGKSELTVKSNSKNLLNLNDLVLKKQSSVNENSVEVDTNQVKFSVIENTSDVYSSVHFDNMIFKPGTRYYFSAKCEVLNGKNVYPVMSIRDVSYNGYLGNIKFDNKNYASGYFTATNNYHRIEFFAGDGKTDVSGAEVLFKDIEIIEASSTENNSNTYTKYVESLLNISLKEPLRALPNGVKDKIIKRNGQWVVERNCGEIILDGSDDENLTNGGISTDKLFAVDINPSNLIKNYSQKVILSNTLATGINNKSEGLYHYYDGIDDTNLVLLISRERLTSQDIRGIKQWLSQNITSIIYVLEEPVYQPLNIDPTVNLYLDTTHISNNSTIPCDIEVTVDRTLNKAREAIEVAKLNPSRHNVSQARMWTNLAKESIKKDALQDELNSIVDINDLTIDKKKVTANFDIYIQSENTLSMSLDTNQVVFDNYSGLEEAEKLKAINISISSSLPYDLNAYMPVGISNQSGTEFISMDTFNIRESSEGVYKTFADTTTKLPLKEDCQAGNNKSHSIDLKLDTDSMYKADIYKTTIKFEAQQK